MKKIKSDVQRLFPVSEREMIYVVVLWNAKSIVFYRVDIKHLQFSVRELNIVGTFAFCAPELDWAQSALWIQWLWSRRPLFNRVLKTAHISHFSLDFTLWRTAHRAC